MWILIKNRTFWYNLYGGNQCCCYLWGGIFLAWRKCVGKHRCWEISSLGNIIAGKNPNAEKTGVEIFALGNFPNPWRKIGVGIFALGFFLWLERSAFLIYRSGVMFREDALGESDSVGTIVSKSQKHADMKSRRVHKCAAPSSTKILRNFVSYFWRGMAWMS